MRGYEIVSLSVEQSELCEDQRNTAWRTINDFSLPSSASRHRQPGPSIDTPPTLCMPYNLSMTALPCHRYHVEGGFETFPQKPPELPLITRPFVEPPQLMAHPQYLFFSTCRRTMG